MKLLNAVARFVDVCIYGLLWVVMLMSEDKSTQTFMTGICAIALWSIAMTLTRLTGGSDA